MSSGRGLILLLACAVVAGWPWGCSSDDPAARLQNWLAEGAVLAEKQDLAGLLERTASEFLAQPGNRARQEVREVLAVAFYRYRGFRLLYPRPAVTLAPNGTSAAISVPFLVVRRERTYPALADLAADPAAWLAQVGENADLYHLELEVEKQDGEWLATAARLW